MRLGFKKYLLYLKKYEIIAVSFVVLVFTILVLVLFLIPKFDKVQKITQESETYLSKKSSLIKKNGMLSSINQDRYGNIYARLNKIIPDKKDYVSLFNTLDDLESRYDVVVLRTDFQLGVVSTQSGNFQKEEGVQAFAIPTSIELTGNLENVKGFLVSLGNFSGRLMSVKEVKWTYYDEGGSVRAMLSGSAYFFPTSHLLGSVDSPLPEIPKEQLSMMDEVLAKAPLEDDKFEQSEVIVGKRNLFQ